MRKLMTLTLVVLFAFGLMAGTALAENNECPAAPAVANQLLREAGESNRYGSGRDGGNYISNVAHEMGSYDEDKKNTDFHGVGKCDQEAYKAAIAVFLVEQGANVEVLDPEDPEPDPETPEVEAGIILNMDTGETYDDIQNAVNDAATGNTLYIGEGTYSGFRLDEALTIIGIGNVTVIASYVEGDPRPNGIFVNTNGEVAVENITFTRGEIELEFYPQGILTSGAYNPTLHFSGNEFVDLHIGVYFNPGASGSITGNSFTDINHAAIGIDSEAGVNITYNTITNALIGLEIFRENVTYHDNIFENVDIEVDDYS
ncbi:MAG: right-handed parallel beta-helix repeat-containing protein [Bacillota bacterium]|nr:right-handed parallel beta-helix repeat-containing protein [Bacillota bacterium]